MKYFKVFLMLILSKSAYITICSLLGAVLSYFLDNILFGISLGVAAFFVIYWRYIGPMNYVTKAKITELVDDELLIDTTINPYSEDTSLLKIERNNWTSGEGVFNRFLNRYRVQEIEKGIVFFNVDMPYLPIYILPWSNIVGIEKDTQLVRDNNISDVEITYEIALIKGSKILLPVSKPALDSWECKKV
jgi:hypothetical protein